MCRRIPSPRPDPSPWRTGLIALLAAVPIIPLIGTAIATAAGTLATTGLPETGPRRALTATTAIALLCILQHRHHHGDHPLARGAHLFAIAVIAFGLGLYGYRARRRRRPGWPPHHAIGMGGSYIALLTGFYVDNGPFLPLWDRLPHITYWVLPSIVGGPLIWLALWRFRTRPAANSDLRVP